MHKKNQNTSIRVQTLAEPSTLQKGMTEYRMHTVPRDITNTSDIKCIFLHKMHFKVLEKAEKRKYIHKKREYYMKLCSKTQANINILIIKYN